ncbi:5862_t:CDS:1, partial [Gigaspora margarita]
INNSSNSNKFVIDHSIKYSKYNFKLQIYEKHSELLFPLIKLETYYILISKQAPNEQVFKTNNKISVFFKNLPNWIKRNYEKEIEKGCKVYEDKENISINNDNFT